MKSREQDGQKLKRKRAEPPVETTSQAGKIILDPAIIEKCHKILKTSEPDAIWPLKDIPQAKIASIVRNTSDSAYYNNSETNSIDNTPSVDNISPTQPLEETATAKEKTRVFFRAPKHSDTNDRNTLFSPTFKNIKKQDSMEIDKQTTKPKQPKHN